MQMCMHSIDDLLPHAPLHYAATGEMVKGSLKYMHGDAKHHTTYKINIESIIILDVSSR